MDFQATSTSLNLLILKAFFDKSIVWSWCWVRLFESIILPNWFATSALLVKSARFKQLWHAVGKVKMRLLARPIRGLRKRHINNNPTNKEMQIPLQTKVNRARLSNIHIKNLTLPVWLDSPWSPTSVVASMAESGMCWYCTVLQIALVQAED